jgi:hypothetical protein
MKVIDLRPPPACLKSYRLKFSLFTKNSLFSHIKQNSIKLAIKLCIDYNEMNKLQYVCPQYPHSYEIPNYNTEMAKLADRSSVLRPCELVIYVIPRRER